MPWGAEFHGVLEPEVVNDTKRIKMIRLGEPPMHHDKFRPRDAAVTRRMLTQYPESPKRKAQMVQIPVKPNPGRTLFVIYTERIELRPIGFTKSFEQTIAALLQSIRSTK